MVAELGMRMRRSAGAWTMLLSILLLLSSIAPAYGWTPTTGWTEFTPADGSDLTLTIRPNADGTFYQWTPLGGGAHYVEVNEEVRDDDTSYVYPTASAQSDSYELQNHTTETWSITNVRVIIWAKQTGNEYCYITLVVGGTEYLGTKTRPGSTYTEYTSDWAQNPVTATDWTWSDIDALEAGVRSLVSGVWSTDMRVTQLYVEVTADPGYDITNVEYGNDGTYLYFRVKTAADSEGKYFNIWMDAEWEGAVGDGGNSLDTGVDPDYRVDTGAMIAYLSGPTTVANGLKYWTGSAWDNKGDIEIDRSGDTNQYFQVRFLLSDIGYVDGTPDGAMNLVVVSGTSAVTSPGSGYQDRAPDLTSYYSIAHEYIPEVPWPLPLVFIPALVISMYILWKKKFSHANRSHSASKVNRGDKA